MKKLIFLLCLGIIAEAKPSHHHYNDVYPINPGVGAIYEGPNSETIIEGPDGSVITSEADGGGVAIEGDEAAVEAVHHVAANAAASHHAVGASAIPSAHSYAETNIISKSPTIVEEPAVIHETVPQAVFIADYDDTSVLEGPSGSVFRHGENAVIAGPASTTIKDGKFVSSIANVEVSGPAVYGHVSTQAVISSVAPAIFDNSQSHQLTGVKNGIVVPQVVVSSPTTVLHQLSGSVADHQVVDVQKQVIISTSASLQHAGVSIDGNVGDHDEIITPQVIISSTRPILQNNPHIANRGYSNTPPIALDHANEAAVSTATAENVRILQSYLPALQYAAYQKAARAKAESQALAENANRQQSYQLAAQDAEYQEAVRAEAERQVLAENAQLQHSYQLAAKNAKHKEATRAEAEREVLEYQLNSGSYTQNRHSLNPVSPVITQGNQIIAGGLVSSTSSPLFATSLSSVTPALNSAKSINEHVDIGSQIYKDNGIGSPTSRPVIVTSTTAPDVASSTLNPVPGYLATNVPVVVDNTPIISRPQAVLTPITTDVGHGQLLLQKSVSSSQSSSHTSSVQHSSTGIISGPVTLDGRQEDIKLVDNVGHGRLPSLGVPDWQQSVDEHGYHVVERVLPVHRGYVH